MKEILSIDEVLAATEVLEKVKDREGLSGVEGSLLDKLEKLPVLRGKASFSIGLTKEEYRTFRDIMMFGYKEY